MRLNVKQCLWVLFIFAISSCSLSVLFLYHKNPFKARELHRNLVYSAEIEAKPPSREIKSEQQSPHIQDKPLTPHIKPNPPIPHIKPNPPIAHIKPNPPKIHIKPIPQIPHIKPSPQKPFVNSRIPNSQNKVNDTHKKVNVSVQKLKHKKTFVDPKLKKLQKYADEVWAKMKINTANPLSYMKFIKDNDKFREVENGMNEFENLTCTIDSTTTEKICNSNTTFIIAIVPSAAGNFDRRQVIRTTWGSSDQLIYTRLRAVFILGATTDDGIQNKVIKEARDYKDIVQMNYIDSYRNLTYKTITGLQWVSENCEDIPWVVKIDDDVVLNPFSLRLFLEEELLKDPSPNVIMGRRRSKSKPMKKGKWAVTAEEYQEKKYPIFILGSAYIIGRNAVENLLYEGAQTKCFHLEDVYVTGILAQKAKIERKDIEFDYFSNGLSSLFYKGPRIFLVGYSKKQFKKAWGLILKYRPPLV